MKQSLAAIAVSCLSVAAGFTDAAEPAGGNTSGTLPTTPQKPASASAGLFNDWLRQPNDRFKVWDVGGQLRGRYEAFDNASPAFPNRDFQKSGVANDNSYFWFRAKMHAGYTGDWFGAYVEGRHSSASGDVDPRDPGADELDLHQAFITLGNAKQFPITAKVGRQELVYGDERLIGAGDWANSGRVFDSAKLRFESQDIGVDVFSGRVVLNDDHNFNMPDDYDWFSGVYASTRTLVPLQETQVYLLSRNSSAGASVSPRDIYSVGARIKSIPGKLQGWDYGAEAVGQRGSVNVAGTRLDHQAFAASVGGGYTWTKIFASPRVGLEYNYSTGDSDSGDDKNETLDNLFPTNHKHYGYMDYVSWRNIHSPRLSLSGKPHPKITTALDYHLFWLADTHDSFYPQAGLGRTGNGYGKNPAFDSFVGSEINLDVTYNVTAWAMVRAGIGHFFTGSYVNSSKSGVGGSTDAGWAYLQTTLNF